MPCALQSSMVCSAAGIHLGLENVLQHQLSGCLPSPLLRHQTQSEATWKFLKPGCSLEISLWLHWLPHGGTAGTPLQYRDHPRGPHRAGQQSWSCTTLLASSAPSPHSSLLNLGTLTCARAGDEPRESWLSSVPAAGAASAARTSLSQSKHPGGSSDPITGSRDLPWGTQGALCFPPFLLGSLRGSQALW